MKNVFLVVAENRPEKTFSFIVVAEDSTDNFLIPVLPPLTRFSGTWDPLYTGGDDDNGEENEEFRALMENEPDGDGDGDGDNDDDDVFNLDFDSI